jgi:hypothetical protein
VVPLRRQHLAFSSVVESDVNVRRAAGFSGDKLL